MDFLWHDCDGHSLEGCAAKNMRTDDRLEAGSIQEELLNEV